MSHSTVLVVLKNSAVKETDIDTALAEALAPFYEYKETPSYIRNTKAQLIAKQRKYYEQVRDEGAYAAYLKDPATYAADCIKRGGQAHLDYISTEFPDEVLPRLDDEAFLYEMAVAGYDEDDLDSEGNELSTYNPLAKWDYYVVGGRWAGSVMNWTDTIEHPAEVITPKWTQKAWTEKVGGPDWIQKKDLNQFSGTFAFLDTEGRWSERGKMGWWGMVADEAPADEWDQRLKQLVEDVEDEDWLVAVDVHI